MAIEPEYVIRILSDFWDKSSGEFLSSLAGASLGAGAAYYLQNKAEKRKAIEAHQGAIVRAQLALMTMLNTLMNIRIQHLDAHRNLPDRANKMKAFWQATSQLKVDYDSMAFLLLTKFANSVQNVYIADRSFTTSIEALTLRNDAYLKLFEESETLAMDASGQTRLRADMKHIKMLSDTTNALFDSVDNAIPKIESAITELREAGKSLFPGMRFLKYDLNANVRVSTPPASVPQQPTNMNDQAHEWSRHYDTIQWTVMSLLLTAAGAMYVFTIEHDSARAATIASGLILVSVFFNASFRKLRRGIQKSWSDEEKNWVVNSGILKQGPLSYMLQIMFFLALVYRIWELRPIAAWRCPLMVYAVVGLAIIYEIYRQGEKPAS